jgi:hypothetical protein
MAAEAAPMPWAQRLGYLRELTGASERADALKHFVRARPTNRQSSSRKSRAGRRLA